MNIAHAIADNTQRAQGMVRPLEDQKILAAADTLTQAGTHLFGTLTTIAGNDDSNSLPDDLLHSIRTDLNNVIGYSDTLADNALIGGDTKLIFAELCKDARVLLQELDEIRKAALSPPSERKGEPGRILLIDDDNANRQVLARHLKQLGHFVETANSGGTVFELLEDKTFDLIFLDLSTPEVTGLEILTRLKSTEAWRAIPVVMISGIHDEDAVIQCIEAGADDFLIKPINRVLLNARLNAGLERKRWLDKEQQYRVDLERSHQFIKDTFGRYVSEEIVENILAQPGGLNLGGKNTEVTILMADIRGFTTMAEKLEPSQVVKLLNNYLGVMSEIIMFHEGTIDEFIGDAILALFGAPIEHPDHADRAIACALDMQAAVKDINTELARQGLPDIGIGVAVNTGPVVAGNIGSSKRIKYGVVGHTVNLTARMESFCRAGEILASQACLDAADRKVNHSYQFEISPKGMVERLRVCNITGIE